MFAYIKGILKAKQNDYIILETGGIGYKINTSLYTIGSVGSIGDEITVYTYLYVREDALSLYGFLTQEELGIFELLISVSGVGPKAALSILSAIPTSKFGLAIVTNDIKALTQAQGIGTKTAQRIILELKDKIKNEQLEQAIFDSGNDEIIFGENSIASEAVSALMVLGYSRQEAGRAVSKIYEDGMDVEKVIKCALKNIAKQ